MTKKEQEQFFDDFTTKMKSIMVGKGDDYATEDRLSNFKYSGSIVGTGKDGRLACLQLIAVKVARLGTLLNSKEGAKNESIDDSILDLANYSVLLAMLQSELGFTREAPTRNIFKGMEVRSKKYFMSSVLSPDKTYKVASREEGKFSVVNHQGQVLWVNDSHFDFWFDEIAQKTKLEIKKGTILCAKKEAAQYGFFEGFNYEVNKVLEKVAIITRGKTDKLVRLSEIDKYFTTESDNVSEAVKRYVNWRNILKKEIVYLKSLTNDDARGFVMSQDYKIVKVQLEHGKESVVVLNKDQHEYTFHLSEIMQLFSATKLT